jgi:hypothetical protein
MCNPASLLRSAASRTLLLLLLVAGTAALPAHATIYNEIGDAGQTQATAQFTTGGSGLLTNIRGSLLSSHDADLYVIYISNPAAFSATTVNPTGGFLDTQLFLLTMAGAPIALNDDAPGGLSLLSTLPVGSASSLAAGFYLLGISMSGYDPVNAVNQLLFASGLSTDVRGPASGLQPGVLGGFFDSTFFNDSGRYDIQLTGARPAIPEPGTGALVLLGVALCAFATTRRRRAPGRPSLV